MNLRTLRKALAAVSAFAIALSAIVVPTAPKATAEQWYDPYVNALNELGVVDNTGDAFRPGATLNRAELAAMIYRAAGYEASDVDPGFTDVRSSDWFYTPVATLKAEGVIQGTSPTTFSPTANVDRAAAMKMITLAFDIPSADSQSFFNDVNAADWFNGYVSSAYHYSIVDGVAGSTNFSPAAPVTRAAIAKMLALALVVSGAEDPEMYARGADGSSAFAGVSADEILAWLGVESTPGETPGEETPAGGAFTGTFGASLATNSPMMATIPNNGFNVPYTYVTFMANGSEDVNVTALTITRTGLGASGNFTNVKLYDGNTQISSEKTLGSQSNNATFNLASTPIVIPAGSSKTVRILADMASPGSGVSNRLGIASAADVTAVGATTGGAVTLGGDFPIYGNIMTTSNANVGTISYEVTDPQGNTASTFYIGDTDRVFTRINLSSTNEDMDLQSLTFRNEGSATESEVGNLSLYKSGTKVAGPAQMVGRYVTLELNPPLFIERGNSVTFELHGDVFGGFNHTVGFDIYRDWHINATGRVYGFPVRVAESGASQTIVSDNITGSRVSFAVGSLNPTAGDVAPNARDFKFLQFNIINTGDSVNIRNLPVRVLPAAGAFTSQLSDVKIWELDDKGTPVKVVAGPVEPTLTVANLNTAQKLVFTDEFEVPANKTNRYMVTADVSNETPAARTFRIDLINPDGTGLAAGLASTSGFEIKNVATNDIIFNNSAAGATHITVDTAGNVRTVNLPSLTFAVSTSPATDAFVRNASNVPVVGLDVRSGSADDVTLTGLTATLTQALNPATARGLTCQAVAGDLDANDIARVKLYVVENGTERLLDGPREVSAGGNTVTFTGFNAKVVAGNTGKFLIRADIPSSATANICPSFRIAAATDVTANDSNGRSLAAAQMTATNINGAANAATAYILAAASGNVRVTVDSSTVSERQVIAGAQGVKATTLKFSAGTVEDIKIQKLRLFNAATGTNDVISSVDLYQGETKVATGTLSATGYVTWEDLNLTIPRDDNRLIEVRLNFNNSAGGINPAGKAPRIVLANLEDNWTDGAAAALPNAVALGTAGDMKAVGVQSGVELANTSAIGDAIAGDRGFNNGAGVDESLCDSAGYLQGNVETAPAEGDTCTVSTTLTTVFALTGNTLAKGQYVYNTKLTLALATDNPTGSQGSATASQKNVFKFTVSAAANEGATNPRQAVVNYLYFQVSGDAEATNFQLFGPSNNYTAAIATSNVVHRTNTLNCSANAANSPACDAAGMKTSRVSVVPFALTGSDAEIPYGQSKTYLLKADVSATTNNDKPIRSLLVSLNEYGTATGGADVIWSDNGTAAQNASTTNVRWIYDETGKTRLEPVPTSWTGSSSITADESAPVLANSGVPGDDTKNLAARSTSATTARVYWNLPIQTVGAAAGFAVTAGNVAATTATQVGNVITVTGATFGLLTNTNSVIDTPATVDAVGADDAAGNTDATATTDSVVIAGF